MQSILDIKKKLEDQEKTNYGIARAKEIEEEQKLSALCKRRDKYEEVLKGKVSGSLNVKEIIEAENAIEILKTYIKIQKIAVNKARDDVKFALSSLMRATAERKVQEKLREKAFNEYKSEYEKEERKQVDELVSFKYTSENKDD